VWFLRSAPTAGTDRRVDAWRASAAGLLPDVPRQVTAETIRMDSGNSTERDTPVDGGSYRLTMVCLGQRGSVRVRLSPTDADSGRAVPCAESPRSVTLTVGLADDFIMHVSAETDRRTVVFRWRLDPARGF